MANALLADISSFQPSVNWQQYASWARAGDGVARVEMRASQGVGEKDTSFESHWTGALGAGCGVIGVYHYAYPNLHPGQSGAQAEASYFARTVGNRLRASDFLMLDYEQNVPEATAAWALDWLIEVEQILGRKPYIYSYEDFIANKLQDKRLAAYPLVYARWTYNPSQRPPCPAPWQSYAIVQYSDKEIVPGIPGHCDANVWIASQAPAPAGKDSSNGMLIQHPSHPGRVDLLYVGTDAEGNVWHNWNDGTSFASLTHPKAESWGKPAGKTLIPWTASGCWSADGSVLQAMVAAEPDGQIYLKAVNYGGTVTLDWTPVAGQSVKPS